ncbi:hypothetical protein KDN24_05515 [Bacillus sp. Bva_UNVM-123]|uniref:hypothetical protein n=1 Tax=Bacillus sp. Bva_UNVM-123 TaxID=2829798 RepID=UPI00391F1EB4
MEVSTFEIGGLVAYALKIVFGNPDVIVLLLAFSIIITLGLVIFRIYEDLSS